MICDRCGESTPRNSNGQKYCPDCYILNQRDAQNRYARKRRKTTYTASGHRRIEVVYPDVALPDYWTRTEYERYKKDLPKDAKVIFR